MRKLLAGVMIGSALTAGSVAAAGSRSTPAAQHARISNQIAVMQRSVARMRDDLGQLQANQTTEQSFLTAINRKIDTLCYEHAQITC